MSHQIRTIPKADATKRTTHICVDASDNIYVKVGSDWTKYDLSALDAGEHTDLPEPARSARSVSDDGKVLELYEYYDASGTAPEERWLDTETKPAYPLWPSGDTQAVPTVGTTTSVKPNAAGRRKQLKENLLARIAGYINDPYYAVMVFQNPTKAEAMSLRWEMLARAIKHNANFSSGEKRNKLKTEVKMKPVAVFEKINGASWQGALPADRSAWTFHKLADNGAATEDTSLAVTVPANFNWLKYIEKNEG